MRKITKILTVLAALSVMAVSMAACSNSDKKPSSSVSQPSAQESLWQESSSNNSEESSKTSKPSTSSKVSTSSATFANMEEYIASPDGQKIIESTRESAGDDMFFDLKAEGNKLIYEYTYTEQCDEDMVEYMKEYFDSAMSSYESMYKNVVKLITELVNDDNASVAIRYLNADGSLIWEKEYTN